MATRTTLTICFTLLLTSALSQEKIILDPPPPGPYRLKADENINHTYSASTSAPMATALNSSAAFRTALSVLTGHFRNESERAYALLQRPLIPFVENRERACNLPDSYSHIASVNRSTSQYGWGVLGEPCTTELETDLHPSIVRSMRTYLHELGLVGTSVVRAVDMHWETVKTFMEFNYSGSIESCSLLHFTAFRVNGTWRINTGLTNAAINVYKEEWHRHYLVEILHLVNGSVTPTTFTLPERPIYGKPVPTGWVPGTTTLLATWGGAPATSLFRHILFVVNNPATRAAIKVGEETREQVQDATTKSNMMILIFPLALALVPLALFADASTPVTVAYTIVTDVMAAMPLAIKGKELMDFGRRRLVGTRTWVYGGRTRHDLAAAETWHAACTVDWKIVARGRLFIGLAVGMMVLGMVMEIYFKRGLAWKKKLYLGRRKKQGKAQLWETAFCNECRCGVEYAHGMNREEFVGLA